MKKINPLLFLLTISILLSSCNTKQAEINNTPTTDLQLGDIHFPVTGAAEAIPHFEKGVLLLHSFEYEDARVAFLKAQELDSTFAMAYWGEAMTYNHTIWQRQEKDKAVAALEKLAPDAAARKALAQTDLEKDFFSAIELLYGEGTKYDRDVAYRDFMEGLTKKYEGNHEVSAFYAISLLGSSRNGREDLLYEKSARIVQGIIAENPKHPGALHYLIHSYDDPDHAHLAKAAADGYSKTAPDAAHALHMPSHIYVALGAWDDVVTSNIASWNASVKRKERMALDHTANSYHALNWLQYGLLQRGETELATSVLQKMIDYAQEDSSKSARAYLVAMKGAHLVETNTWEGDFTDLDIDPTDLDFVKIANVNFLKGMKAYHRKDLNEMRSIIKSITKERTKAMVNLGDGAFAMCSGANLGTKPPSQLDVEMVQVMEMELEAYAATLANKKEEAAKWFEEACALDATLKYSYGPPIILKPIYEAYAEWLLENNNPTQALTYFEKSLDRYPGRLLSLEGMKKTAEILKRAEVLVEMDKVMAENTAVKARGEIL
jgi:hypothetical protein